jgi:GDPmannose 4,6-dehydratase
VPTALITGITGQDGSYLAEFLLARNYRVVGLVRPDSPERGPRLEACQDRVELVCGSLSDQPRLQAIIEEIRPTEIYNFAARASSSQLFNDPLLTSEVNGLAVVRLLELIRLVDPGIRFCQASSSEMFGDAQATPQSEVTPFRPRNPYGIAKLFAHGMVGSYRVNHDLFSCSSILFNHESPRRGTDFVTRRISMGVARISLGLESRLQLGSLDATRDWGYAADYVRAMWLMLQASRPDDYVLATGISHSVAEFCEVAFRHVGLDYRNYVVLDPGAIRPPDRTPLVGDSRKAQNALDWSHTVSFEQLVHMMVDADIRALATAAGTSEQQSRWGMTNI